MGCCGGDSEEATKNKNINKELQNDAQAKIVSLLILGCGESGKITVLKQMKMYHNKAFTESELKYFRIVLRKNIVNGLRTIYYYLDSLGKHPSNSVEKLVVEQLWEHDFGVPFSDFHNRLLNEWSADPIVKKAIHDKSAELQLPDCFSYFLENCARITDPKFEPNNDDILRARVATFGIVETRIETSKHTLLIIDIGGQRSERKKWFSCFDNVTALLYVVSLSEYNQLLSEDNKTNRTKESLDVFEKVVNDPSLRTRPLVIFFNKVDLFKAKLERFPLHNYFPEYVGSTEEEAIDFIQSLYMARIKLADKDHAHYHYTTCATDQGQMEATLEAIEDIIQSMHLKAAGIN